MNHLFGTLSRQKWVVLAVTLAVAAASIAGSLLTPKSYQGVAKVLVYDKSRVAVQEQRAMVTELELAKNPAFAVEAVSALRLTESPSDVLSHVTASVVGDTNVIAISATADTPAKASDIANSVASGFAEWSNDMQRRALTAQADAAEQQMEDVAKRVAAVRLSKTPVRSANASDSFFVLVSQNNALRAITQKLNDLRISQRSEANAVQVVIPARPDGVPVAPKTARNALLGVVIGLILGVCTALLIERPAWLLGLAEEPADAQR